MGPFGAAASVRFIPTMPAVRNSTSSSSAGPALVPVGDHQGEKPLPLNRLFTLIGSAPSARIYLPSKSVSRCHAVIINAGSPFIRDLASRTHTRVNGRVVDEAQLREGDVVSIGRFSFKFTDAAGKDSQAPAALGPDAVLEVQGLDEPLPVKGRTLLIGRRETADVSLTENTASSAHALLFVAEGKHLLRDLKSRTGTFVNGVKVDEHALSPGDVFRVGETTFHYILRGGGIPAREPSAATEAPAPIPDTIPDPAPHGVVHSPPEPSRPSDFDFIPVELAPEESAPSPAEPSPAPDGGPSVGLLELSEPPPQESKAVERNGDGATPAVTPPPPKADKPKPPRWSKAAAARPPVPAPTDTDRPARPLSPFDLLGEADELEPLPEPTPDDAPSGASLEDDPEPQ